MRRALLIAFLGAVLLLLGCEDEARVAERAQAAQEREARIETARAKIEAERSLLMSPQHAVPELWRRLADVAKIEGGVVTIVTERTSNLGRVHAFPTTVAWRITCDTRGLAVVFGPWLDGDRDTVNPVLVTDLTTARLTEEECLPLVAGLSRKLAAALRD